MGKVENPFGAGKKYNVILADPPWRYRDPCKAGKRGAGFKYPTMHLWDIGCLPVPEICSFNCALFLWTTMPMIPDALTTMKGWGFAFKTVAFVWVKCKDTMRVRREYPDFGAEIQFPMGMGHYTRSNAELVLLGTRGRLERKSKSVSQIVVAKRGRHSQKPAQVRRRIVELFGDVPRIELFARDVAPGWDAWGNEL